MKDWILETRHLTKSYKGQQAVSDISLKIPRMVFMDFWGRMGPEVYNTQNAYWDSEARQWSGDF